MTDACFCKCIFFGAKRSIYCTRIRCGYTAWCSYANL